MKKKYYAVSIGKGDEIRIANNFEAFLRKLIFGVALKVKERYKSIDYYDDNDIVDDIHIALGVLIDKTLEDYANRKEKLMGDI